MINSSISERDFQEYSELIQQGMSQRSACEVLSLSRSSVQRYIKKLNELNIDGDTTVGTTADGEVVTKAPNKPKVLFYDIETTLAKSYHFQQWKVNLSQKQKIEESHLLSIAWCWNDGDVNGDILSQREVLEHDDERLVLKVWCLLDNADIVIGHNLRRFDNKKANSYFLKYGLNPPSPYRTIDTLQIAKSKFALPFNNLDYIAEYLNVGRKIPTDVQLWIDCDKGNQDALDLMLDYNKQDVVVLRDVYKRLLTWSNNNVNMNTYNDDRFSCTNCGSGKVEMITNKFVHTNTNKYLAYRCSGCGSVMRGNRHNSVSDKLVIV